MEDGKRYFTISQFSRMLDISGPTLRFWESEFAGIFTPLRTPGGQRRYTDEHIHILEKIVSMKKEGLKLTEIRAEMLRVPLPGNPDMSLDKVDILAERISRAVKNEIYRFFKDSPVDIEKRPATRRGSRRKRP